MIISFKGTEVYGHLDWRLLEDANRKDIRKLFDDNGVTHGVVIGEPKAAAVAVGLCKDKYVGVSAAGWLAQSFRGQNVVFADKTDRGDIWVCVIENGLPMSGMDFLCSYDEAERTVSMFADEKRFKVITSLEFSDTEDRRRFNDVVTGRGPKITGKSGLSREKLVRLGLIGILVCGIAGGPSLYKSYQEGVIKKEREARMNEAKAAEREAREARRKAAIQKAEADIVYGVLNTPSSYAMIDSWLSTVYAIPLFVAGWEFSGVKCSPASCSTTWKRVTYTTATDFKREISAINSGDVVFNKEGNEAMIDFAVVAPPNRAGIADDIPQGEGARLVLLTAIQKTELAGVAGTVGDAQTSTVPIMGADGAVIEENLQLPWKTGTVSLKLNRYFELGAPAITFNQEYVAPTTLVIEGISKQTQNITLEMKYVVK